MYLGGLSFLLSNNVVFSRSHNLHRCRGIRLLLISGLVEYHCEAFSWGRVVYIPLSKFRQWTTFVLLKKKKNTHTNDTSFVFHKHSSLLSSILIGTFLACFNYLGWVNLELVADIVDEFVFYSILITLLQPKISEIQILIWKFKWNIRN